MFHPRNKHQGRYDFKKLISSSPHLEIYVKKNKYGDFSIDFSNPDAVISLNKALLSHYYGITKWDIPKNNLCPPIPGRADYIHHIADILAKNNLGSVPTGDQIKILDIGVGANCIYPILGNQEYNWNFIGTDINPQSIKAAMMMIESNEILKNKIEIRLQQNESNIFSGIIKNSEKITCTMSNPPFYESIEDAQNESKRKWKNLGKPNISNFGGKDSELWCNGGELGFILKMVKESSKFKTNVEWFSTLVSKEKNVYSVSNAIHAVSAKRFIKIDLDHGQKKSRIIFWSFK